MKKIGLKRGTVELVKHDKNWKNAFEKEKINIQKILGKYAKEIEHIGSTSISRIKAKPLIDILIGVESIRKNGKNYIKKMNFANYVYRSKFGNSNHILFVKGNEESRTHYIHIVKYRGVKWNKYILFRNYLRDNFRVAKKYENLKINLAQKFPDARNEYTKRKSEFVEQTIALARRRKYEKAK